MGKKRESKAFGDVDQKVHLCFLESHTIFLLEDFDLLCAGTVSWCDTTVLGGGGETRPTSCLKSGGGRCAEHI